MNSPPNSPPNSTAPPSLRSALAHPVAWAGRLPFFYGYVMMPVAMLVLICTSPGQTFAVSAFKPALLKGLELSESQLSFAYMLGTLLAALPLSLVGPLADRWGLRRVTLLTILMLAGTCYGASKVDGFMGLLCVFLMLRFLGQGSLTLLGGNTLSMWFRSRLGRMSAIISIGTAIAFAWVPQWLTDSIRGNGWRETFVGIAVLIASVVVPLVWFLFLNRPEEIGQCVDGESSIDESGDTFDAMPPGETRSSSAIDVQRQEVSWDLGQACRTKAFPILSACNAVWAMIGTAVVFHLFTLCQDRGMSEDLPPDLFKVFGLSMLVMQLGGGVLTDFLRLHRLLGIGVFLLTIGMGSLAVGESSGHFYGFAAAFGAGQGLLIAVNAVVWVRYFGREHLGKIRGAVWCLTVAGSGCGPLLMGITRDRWGLFDPAIASLTALLVPLAIAAWFAVPPPIAQNCANAQQSAVQD
ncbi:MAG: MFS transporter [Planctomycetota bacterium]